MKKTFFSIFLTFFFFSFAFAQESKPLKIIDQPKPELPKNYGTLDVQGTIIFRVEFLANGQIGVVSSVNGIIPSLNQLALEAVKKIKFEPEVNDGKSISVFKTVSYYYSWQFVGWKIPAKDTKSAQVDEKAEAVLRKAVEKLGGEKYLQVKSTIGRGRFSVIREGAIISFQSFIDVIVHPDKERTEFKDGGVKTVQTNTGETGWIFDGSAETINLQNKEQIENFKRSLRVSLDSLLRGYWRGKASLSYVGKRAATLGKRNEVVKLTFADEFAVEFEFSDEFMPVKALYKRINTDKEEVKEEDRYAQFVDFQGIKTPLIVDHFSNGAQTSRINYESIEFNKTIPEKIFAKPESAKELKKDLKL